ncbi:conjugal transfer protein TraN, partial [Halomonas sp. ND22Bw]
QVVNERRNEAMCNAATSGKTCELKGETCVDPDPTTRTINGVQVTRACWNWERTYTCTSMIQTSDCASLAGNPKCSYVRDECLDDPQDG